MGITAGGVLRMWWSEPVLAVPSVEGVTHWGQSRSPQSSTLSLSGAWPSCWGCSTQPIPVAEPITGKCHFVKCQSGTSRGYLPWLVAEALTLLCTQFALVCWNAVVWWFASLLFYYGYVRGAVVAEIGVPSGCMFAAMQECLVIAVFKMNHSPDVLGSFPSGR